MKLPKELRKVLTQVDFPSEQYFRQSQEKTQIYLHHTGSSKDVKGDIRYWESDKARIATAFIIDNERINQLFSSNFWAHHLGIKRDFFQENNLAPINVKLNKISIGIELDAWGPLEKKGHRFYSWAGTEVDKKEVCTLEEEYRGYKHYHKYSEKQLELLGILLKYLSKRYNISLDYNEDIWDITDRALKAEPGLYSHTSVRHDKSDVFPQPELIELLKSLTETEMEKQGEKQEQDKKEGEKDKENQNKKENEDKGKEKSSTQSQDSDAIDGPGGEPDGGPGGGN